MKVIVSAHEFDDWLSVLARRIPYRVIMCDLWFLYHFWKTQKEMMDTIGAAW